MTTRRNPRQSKKKDADPVGANDQNAHGEKLISAVSDLLNISLGDAYQLISNTLTSEEALLDCLGYESIDLVSEILRNRHLFTKEEEFNDELKYVEYVLPEPARMPVKEDTLVPVSRTGLDSAYFSYGLFNAVQSAVFEAVYGGDENVLVCAPTGAGKTDIALLGILRATRNYRRGGGECKAIYIAPMKALATEITAKYQRVFSDDPGCVIEYTGDVEMAAAKANRARVLVCTPEKFDVATRALAPGLTGICLVVIDEIHLLGDARGPVLEMIVARMFRTTEMSQCLVRIIGLSATLPNYRDVGAFIRAGRTFHFGPEYRPVPLRTTIVGFKKGSKRRDEESYLASKVKYFIKQKKQVLVFVHSRQKTTTVAKMLNEAFLEDLHESGCIKSINNKIMHVGIHHAGLSRTDRLSTEDSFRRGALSVLVCTSTLAWGVNLPAHAAIIYGTQFYSPEKGAFDDISILDVVQIFGRAGRPQFDSRGEAILITRAGAVSGYLAALKESKDVESNLLHWFTEAVCAEIYLRSISSMATALSWLKNTFLYVRMLKSPAYYGLVEPAGNVIVNSIPLQNSSDLPAGGFTVDENALCDYVFIAVKRLESCKLINIIQRVPGDRNTWIFTPTPFAGIASRHYLQHRTIHHWLSALPTTETDIILLLLGSQEFSNINLRTEEIPLLNSLHTRLLMHCSIDTEFEASIECKLTTLLAAYFCYQKPPSFSLLCDTDFIVDTLLRMVSALGKILLHFHRYTPFYRTVILGEKLRRARLKKSEFFKARAVRCGEFISLAIDVNKECGSNFTVVLRRNEEIVYGSEFASSYRGFIRVIGEGMDIMDNSRLSMDSHKALIDKDKLLIDKDKALIDKDKALIDIGRLSINDTKPLINDIKPSMDRDKLDNINESNYKLQNIKQTNRLSVEVRGEGLWNKVPLDPVADYSPYGLLYYGIHSCDVDIALGSMDKECVHFLKGGDSLQKGRINCLLNTKNEVFGKRIKGEFKLDVKLMKISAIGWKEKMSAMENEIVGLEGDMLVVDSERNEKTVRNINTQLMLASRFDRLFVAGKKGEGNRRVVSLKEAEELVGGHSTVVFKGCSNGMDYYPMVSILRLCDGKEAIIYEGEEYIEYFKAVTKQNKN